MRQFDRYTCVILAAMAICVSAFQEPLIGQRYAPLRPCTGALSKKWRHDQRIHPLRYRELDEKDSETTQLRLDNRMPPGFNLKDAIGKKRKEQGSAINLPLILALQQNQLLILGFASALASFALIVSDGFNALRPGLFHWVGTASNFDFSLSPERFVAGALGGLAVIAQNAIIERSDNPRFANVNFSTIIMTMTLFGRRKEPPQDFVPEKFRGLPIATTKSLDVVLQSLLMSILTGFCEELVFRCIVPSLINHYFGPSIALSLIGSSLLFGLGHIAPGSSFAENSLVMSLQALNGTLFGLIYVFSGGDIVSCMIAHALYDFSVFFGTWQSSNAQLEYAEKKYLDKLDPDEQSEFQRIRSQAGAKIDNQFFNVIKRLYYTFDFDKNETLSLSEVRKGVAYLWLEKASNPPPQRLIDAIFQKCIEKRDEMGVDVRPQDRNRLRFPDFTRLFLTLESEKAPKTF